MITRPLRLLPGAFERTAAAILLLIGSAQFALVLAGWVYFLAGTQVGDGFLSTLSDLRMYRAMFLTAALTIIALSLEIVFGLGLAVALQNAGNLFLTMLAMPALIAPASVALAAYMVVSPVISPLAGLHPVASHICAYLFSTRTGTLLLIFAIDLWQWGHPPGSRDHHLWIPPLARPSRSLENRRRDAGSIGPLRYCARRRSDCDDVRDDPGLRSD
jgi:hypothetical protein